VVRCDPPTSAHPGDKAVIDADGRLHGWIGGSCSEPLVRREALRALDDGLPRLVRIVPSDAVKQTRKHGELTMATTCPSGGALDIFLEPQLPKPLLVVFGDPPAARTMVQLARLVGFRTCAVRLETRSDDSTDADTVLSSLDLSQVHVGPDTWMVVATMGHYDEDALQAALAYADADVALVASSRRSAAVLDELRRRGLPETTLKRIRTPAGRQRAGTQEEIALAALGELVGIRQRRRQAGRSRGAGSAPAGADAFATDPVCGMTVEMAAAPNTAVHGLATYYFCSAACHQQFAGEPQRFLQPESA
jgi:xanthine dehydrogenase accessory factor